MEESYTEKILALRKMFAETSPTNPQDVEQYVGIITLSILKSAKELGSLQCRQMLAETIKLPLQRPSYHYSSILLAATKMAKLFPDFHYIQFLNLWNPQQNLRPEDFEATKSKDGKTFPPLAESMCKQMLLAQLLRPQEHADYQIPEQFGYLPITPMVVVSTNHIERNGRPFYYVQLIDAHGNTTTCELHVLRPNPLTADPSKRSYVNVGQVYDVVLRNKKNGEGVTLVDAMLSNRKAADIVPTTVGYVAHIDKEHNHIHIYDGQSRHFVSNGQRFIKASEGQLVEFIPIIPKNSGFKSAIIVASSRPQASLQEAFPERDIVITHLNEEKGYCRWQLIDTTHPIVETLSDFQRTKGEICEPFTSGFLDLQPTRAIKPDLAVGDKARAIIYLQRGKDHKKHPHLEKLTF